LFVENKPVGVNWLIYRVYSSLSSDSVFYWGH